MHLPGLGNWVIIAVIGLLFFGKRLPEVGKSVAGAIVNFKKGLKEAQDEIQLAGEPSNSALPTRTQVSSLPADAKFDPYTGKPIEVAKFDPHTGKPINETVEATVSHGEPL